MQLKNKEHYGVDKAVSEEVEALRHSDSLCYNCARFKPGKPDQCPAAEDFFKACKKWNLAVAVCMCPSDMFVLAEKNFHAEVDSNNVFGLGVGQG